MTRGSKYLTLFLVQAGLLAAAFGGGYRHEQLALTPQLASCEQKRADLEKAVKPYEARVARGLIMESLVGTLVGNPAYASERLLRAQLTAQKAGLKLDSEFEELNSRLLTQDPQAREALMRLADKVASLPLSVPSASGAGKDAPRPADAKAPGSAAAPDSKDGKDSKVGAATPASAAAASPSAAAPPSAAAALAPGSLAAPVVAAAPARNDATQRALDEGRRALLDAKVAVLSGGEAASTAAVVGKLAQARVMLDEAGRSDLDEALDGALDAARKKDDARLRAAIDAVLKQLRG